MGAGWSTATMGEVAPLVRRPVETVADATYREIGIRSFGKGVFHKAPTTGLEIGSKRVFAIEPGDLLFNIVFAWEGAVAVAGESERGMIGSHRFLTCVTDKERVDARFLNYWFSRGEGRDRLLWASPGGAGRNRTLGIEKLAAIEVPLPPLDEQRRIVARIDALAAKIAEARGLKAETKFSCDRFWKTLSAMARSPGFPARPLEELVEFLDGRRIPLSESERQGRKGEFPYYGASGIIDFVDDYIFDEPLVLLSEDGANLIARSKPIAFVAEGRYWVNNHAHVLKAYPTLMDTRFLAYALSDFDVSVFNFASAQAKLNQRYARQISIPVPPLPEQRRIVAELDTLQAKVDALKRLQAETSAELDALLPAILDRAFKGEL
jgi:type I restriction enzyme S subunit